jgi:hypothetical protein
MKKIPEEILEKAYLNSIVKRKSPGEYTGRIARAVAVLHACRELDTTPDAAWQRLRAVLDDAMTAGDWAAMDDLAKLWTGQSTKVMQVEIRTSAHSEPRTVPAGGPKDAGLRPITKMLVTAIRNLQRGKKCAPTRQEILAEMGKLGDGSRGVDEAELSRQLTRLPRWGIIPRAAGDLFCRVGIRAAREVFSQGPAEPSR